MDRLIEWLPRTSAEGEPRIVHGDYRITI